MNAYSLAGPAFNWVKWRSSREIAAAFPPIASNSPRRLNGTIHTYCAALPSQNPSCEAGWKVGIGEPPWSRGTM